jgi:preprotein translocase subunit SecA
MRDELMKSEDISETIEAARADTIANLFGQFIPPQTLEEQWDVKGLEEALDRDMGMHLPIQQWLDEDSRLDEDRLLQRIGDRLGEIYRDKAEAIGPPVMRHFEKTVMLQVLDDSWKEHLAAMDHLRQGIHLRGYAQKDPKQEYKKEAFEMFTSMLDGIKHEVIGIVSKVQVRSEEEVTQMEEQNRTPQEFEYQHAEVSAMSAGAEAGDEEVSGEPAAPPLTKPYTREGAKVGRNDPCPCGSGKKYKACHGKLD